MATFNFLQIVSASAIPDSAPDSWSYPPASARVSYNDVSSPNAGRTEDGTMYKERVGTCAKIELKWSCVDSVTAAAILAAFQPEYIYVRYHDPRTNTARRGLFYAGDRGSAIYNSTLDLYESITVNIIEKAPW